MYIFDFGVNCQFNRSFGLQKSMQAAVVNSFYKLQFGLAEVTSVHCLIKPETQVNVEQG